MSLKWGVLGTANIAKGCTIPGMKEALNCELYAIAGTLCEEADIKILLFTTFETNKYDEKCGQRNDNDLNDFLKLLDIEIVPENCWKLNFGKQTMCVLNKHVNVNYENR